MRNRVIEPDTEEPVPIQLAPNKLTIHVPEPLRAANKTLVRTVCEEVCDSFSRNNSVLAYR